MLYAHAVDVLAAHAATSRLDTRALRALGLVVLRQRARLASQQQRVGLSKKGGEE
jgi:hypothetical protein